MLITYLKMINMGRNVSDLRQIAFKKYNFNCIAYVGFIA